MPKSVEDVSQPRALSDTPIPPPLEVFILHESSETGCPGHHVWI